MRGLREGADEAVFGAVSPRFDAAAIAPPHPARPPREVSKVRRCRTAETSHQGGSVFRLSHNVRYCLALYLHESRFLIALMAMCVVKDCAVHPILVLFISVRPRVSRNRFAFAFDAHHDGPPFNDRRRSSKTDRQAGSSAQLAKSKGRSAISRSRSPSIIMPRRFTTSSCPNASTAWTSSGSAK